MRTSKLVAVTNEKTSTLDRAWYMLLALTMPQAAHACAVCFSMEGGASKLARGFYWGVLLLLILPFFLILSIAAAIILASRKKRLLIQTPTPVH